MQTTGASRSGLILAANMFYGKSMKWTFELRCDANGGHCYNQSSMIWVLLVYADRLVVCPYFTTDCISPKYSNIPLKLRHVLKQLKNSLITLHSSIVPKTEVMTQVQDLKICLDMASVKQHHSIKCFWFFFLKLDHKFQILSFYWIRFT